MDSRGTDRIEELPVADTPEDVAVLYSWANLHGAKYRDFSASRREYRAQLRHRAAEQVREQELKAQADAEASAVAAEVAAREAETTASSSVDMQQESLRQQALREAGRALRIASAERVEATRRAEAAATAEAAARRAEREIAEANVSARKQSERYTDSDMRRRGRASDSTIGIPGEMSDPYTPNLHQYEQAERPYERSPVALNQGRAAGGSPRATPEGIPFAVPPRQEEQRTSIAPPQLQERQRDVPARTPVPTPYEEERRSPPVNRQVPVAANPPDVPVQRDGEMLQQRQEEGVSSPSRNQDQRRSSGQRRPQGYHPDDASGVRQIYRGPEFDEPEGEYVAAQPIQYVAPSRSQPEFPLAPRVPPAARGPVAPPAQAASIPAKPTSQAAGWPFSAAEQFESNFDARMTRPEPISEGTGQADYSVANYPAASQSVANYSAPKTPGSAREGGPNALKACSTFAPPSVAGEASRGRRAQDDQGLRNTSRLPELERRNSIPPLARPLPSSGARAPYVADPNGPAWLYAPHSATPATQAGVVRSSSSSNQLASPQSSVADTLQHSRERVAARWYALKGVFEQPGHEQPEAPIRQKETKTPVLAVFSLAGGVGKTSLVATLGRSLSSMGEKVLLTDTTSHGLLPFYFGASELRQGVVRTFSPPSGSTDAPIYLVSYDVDLKNCDDAAQDQLVDEIKTNSKGMQRILLDLTPGSGWIVRKMARMNPTILVPVAPDMNSVISLQAVEKYFHGTVDSDGRPLQPYYLINQFDASLPLHLDVREVLRRQLGDRLLPFVIRRAPSVSEALAEGMTVVDYAPEEPVTGDYGNVAAWLRTIAAPATAGFRNVRWSER